MPPWIQILTVLVVGLLVHYVKVNDIKNYVLSLFGKILFIVPDSVGGYSLFVIVPDSVGGYSLFIVPDSVGVYSLFVSFVCLFVCLCVCVCVCLSVSPFSQPCFNTETVSFVSYTGMANHRSLLNLDLIRPC